MIKVKPLVWSPDLPPGRGAPYNHCVADTLMGRFLITWKGWKEDPDYDVDETPWGLPFRGAWSSAAEARAACEAEFARRIMGCVEA